MKIKATLFTSLLLASTASWAGGYQLQEYSVVNAGRAFGGAGIVGDDYSAVAFNPAGMTLKQSGVQLGAMAMDIHSKIDGHLNDTPRTADKGKLRNFKVIPHGFGQYALAENWRLGLGVYVPFGLGTYYNKSWFAKSHALTSEISTIDINPSLAWKPLEWLSVGGGFIVERMEARLTNATGPNGMLSDMNADGWGHGWNAGIMLSPTQTTRFGLAYRSPVVQNIKGKHHLQTTTILGNLEGISSTKLVDPEHIQFTAYQEVGKFGLSAMARWTRWSRFNLLSIDSTALDRLHKSPSQVNENWRNAWTVSGGLDYHYCKNLTFRTGLAYDQGAVKDPEHRTARVPDSNRWIAGIGASYMKGNWQFDVSYFHMFWNKARVNNYNTSTGTTIRGTYKTQINSVGLSAQYHF